VDVESDEDLLALPPQQLLTATSNSSSSSSAASTAMYPPYTTYVPPSHSSQPPTQKKALTVDGNVPGLVPGGQKPKVNLSSFEYSEGESYPNWFFEGYSHVGVHATMLKDKYRSLTYRKMIEDNIELFKDKVVMDIGCGTGVWACMAALLGAKRVYAIEASGMAEVAKQVVNENGFQGKVTIFHDTVENMVEKGIKDDEGNDLVIDVLISEWMGYYLLSEGVLPSVFRARDAWLRKETGVVFPSHCAMYLAPFTDRAYADYWDDVYGVNLAPMKKYIGERDWSRKFPSIESISADCMLSKKCMVKWVDCVRDTVEDITNFETKFSLQVSKSGNWQGFLGFWSVFFDPTCAKSNPVRRPEDVIADGEAKKINSLSTFPYESKNFATHWYHSVLLTEPDHVQEGDTIEGTFGWIPNKFESRYYDCTITWSHNKKPTKTKTWGKC